MVQANIQGLVVVVPLSTAAQTLVTVQALPVEEPTTMQARDKMWLSVCLAMMVDYASPGEGCKGTFWLVTMKCTLLCYLSWASFPNGQQPIA